MYIQDVYEDATLLVTGGTGFVGKGLIAKILRTCTKVRKVIVLIRAKGNISTEQRLNHLKSNVVFERLRATHPTALDKLWAVHGDIGCAPNMDLSASDAQMLRDEVNFVFHSAATVSFNLPFETTSNMNILGTKRILDLCREMPNLKSVVYVSTAYTGVCSKYHTEQLYSAKRPIDLERLLNVLSTGTPTEMLEEARLYQDDHPNTYTLSKFFAEHLVNDYFRKYRMPICIVRPSIITSAYADPSPGWVSGYNGVIGAIMDPARGAIRSITGKEDILMDVVPVDFVCNLMVVAAWWTIREQSSEMRIYNHTTGNINPLPSKLLYETAAKVGRLYPSKYTVSDPHCSLTESQLVYSYNKWTHQMITAYVCDMLQRVRGEKPMFVKLSTIYNKFMESVSFFRMHDFAFCNHNVLALVDDSQAASDHAEFPMDFRVVDIESYIRDMWLGIRQHLLKEDVSQCIANSWPRT